MARIGNARTIADITFVIEPPSAGSDVTTWQAFGASCSRDGHRFSGPSYAFSFEIIQVRFDGPPRWHVVIVSERWHFSGARSEPRSSASLKVVHGRAADVLTWMRRCRDQKLNKKSASES